jgi:hypothetical protein
MTDIEDQLRRYAEAISRAQRPVDLGEVMSRQGPRSRRLLVGSVALAVALSAVAGTLIFQHHRDGPRQVVVAPVPSLVPTRRDCPAASLEVTSTGGERLHARWLPPGYTRTEGNQNDLAALASITYSGPATGYAWRVGLIRYRSRAPLAQFVMGEATRNITVQGHAGIMTGPTRPGEDFTFVAWRPAPGIALVTSGWNLHQADLVKVAQNVSYDPGEKFTYPVRPVVKVTREEALRKLGTSVAGARAALTSYGELTKIIGGRLPTGSHLAAADVPVIGAIWVAWTPSSRRSDPMVENATVVDAESGEIIARLPELPGGVLGNLTDRSGPACAPPFGVLTRAEVSYLYHYPTGPMSSLKLLTQGTLDANRTFAHFAQCITFACDPTVPVWLSVQAAAGDRYAPDRGPVYEPERSPGGGPTGSTQRGSWTMTALDARTGPQDTGLSGASSGLGRPPADILALTDLSPAT